MWLVVAVLQSFEVRALRLSEALSLSAVSIPGAGGELKSISLAVQKQIIVGLGYSSDTV